MKSAKFALGLVVQLLAASAVFVVIVLWRGYWDVTRWIGFSIGLLALAGLFVARFQLGKSFAVTPQAKQLVTHGLYSKIRNPMYLFSSSLVVGFALATRLVFSLLLIVILVPLQFIRARQEARVLEDKFGDEYREYRKKTWF